MPLAGFRGGGSWGGPPNNSMKLLRRLTPEDVNGNQYQALMYEIKKRAKWTCEVCNYKTRIKEHIEIAVHHKNKNSTDHRKENLAVVCYDCHSKIHGKLLSRKRQRIVRERAELTALRLARSEQPRQRRKYDEQGWPV